MVELKNDGTRRVAMLIDGDNAQFSLIDKVLTEASKYGLVTIRRIYGDWTEANMKGWKQTLHTHAIQPIQQFRYTVGKNATDSAMIIDAMDILYTAGVDGFCIVSSDSDYTRLATRIREKNLFVMGIGKKNTARAFVNACDVFVYTENLEAPNEVEKQPIPSSVAADLITAEKTTPDLRELFKTAFDLSVQEDEWAFLGVLGNKLRQLDPGFDPRTYGYQQLLLLVQAHPEWFEIRKTQEHGAAQIYVRWLAEEPPKQKPKARTTRKRSSSSSSNRSKVTKKS